MEPLQSQSRWQRMSRWLLGPRRQPAIPWTGLQILLIVWFCELVIPMVAMSLLESATAHTSQSPGIATTEEPGRIDRIRVSVWVNALSLPFQVGLILMVIREMGEGRAYQLGLHWHKGWRQVLLGMLAGLILIPLVLAINMGVNRIYQIATGTEPTLHPFYQLKGQLTPLIWIGLLLAVIVAAPVREELLLRGLIQPFLARHPWGGLVAIFFAFVVAFIKSDPTAVSGEANNFLGRLAPYQPAIFVALMAPWVGLLKGGRPRAVYGTALLFGALHSSVWPTPIALFVLGLGLGWLASRTRSLIAPITLHALFNAIGCIQFVI